MSIADLALAFLVGACHAALRAGDPTEAQELAALNFLDAFEGGVHRGPVVVGARGPNQDAVVRHHVVRLRTPGDIARFLGLRHVDSRTLN